MRPSTAAPAVGRVPDAVARRRVDHLKIEDMACIVSTGYGRAVVPFAHRADHRDQLPLPRSAVVRAGVSTVLDVGGQDSKGIRVGAKGEIADFVMNDKCAAGTGRFMEIVAEACRFPVRDRSAVAAEHESPAVQHDLCGLRPGAAITLLRKGERKEDILAGLHEAIATRVTALVRKVGIADKFVITGGIGRNVGLVSRSKSSSRG